MNTDLLNPFRYVDLDMHLDRTAPDTRAADESDKLAILREGIATRRFTVKLGTERVSLARLLFEATDIAGAPEGRDVVSCLLHGGDREKLLDELAVAWARANAEASE